MAKKGKMNKRANKKVNKNSISNGFSFFSSLNILKLQLKEESLTGEPSGFLNVPSERW